ATNNNGGGPLPDGTYQMTAQQVDLAGNTSAASAPMAPPLVVDTVPPAQATLALDPGSDSGTVGDNATAVIPQQYNGTTAAGAGLTFLDGATAFGPFDTTRIGQAQTA